MIDKDDDDEEDYDYENDDVIDKDNDSDDFCCCQYGVHHVGVFYVLSRSLQYV